MGWQEDYYGKSYKSQKTYQAAQKAKNTKEKNKYAAYAAYDNATRQSAQEFARQNGIKYDENFYNSYNKAVTNKYREKDYLELNQKHQEDWQKKTSQTGKAAYRKADEYETSSYNQMRKDLGYSKESSPSLVSKAEYNRLEADYEARKEDGSAKFIKDIMKKSKTSKDLKVNHNQTFDDKVNKGLKGLAGFIDKVKNSKVVQGTEDLIKKIDDNKLGHAYTQFGKEVIKHTPAGQQVEGIKTVNNAMPIVDQYGGANSTRNVIADLTDKNKSNNNIMKDIKEGFTGKQKTSGEEIARNLGIDSKYGSKAAGFGVELLADPTNFIPVGIAGKVLKGGKKGLEALKAVEEVSKATNAAEDLSKFPKNYQGLYLIKDDYPMQTKAQLQKMNEAIKNPAPAAQEVITQEQKINEAIQNINENPEMKKSLSLGLKDSNKLRPFKESNQPKLVESEPIKPAPVNYQAQKQELEAIHAADRDQFAKANEPTIQAISAERSKAVDDFTKQEYEWLGHEAAAEHYDEVMKSVGRLNLGKYDHKYLSGLFEGKHMYSAAGKGQGDDIYKIADDLGYRNPEEMIQDLNHAYASKQVIKAGKNRFFTVDGKKLQNPDPEAIIDEMHGQSQTAQQLRKDIAEMDRLHNEQQAQQITPQPQTIEHPGSDHMASYGPTTHEKISAAPVAGMDPTLAPLAEKQLPIGHDVPYQKGDELPDVSKQVTSKTKNSLKEKLPSKASIIQQTVDNIHSFRYADDIAKESNGGNLHADESMYKVGQTSRGSDVTAHHIVTEEMVNKHGEVVGSSLKKALEGMKNFSEAKKKSFSDYLVLKHSVTRMKRGEKVYNDKMLMSIPKARDLIKKMQKENPEFRKLSKNFYQYQKQLEKTWAVDTGLMSKEDYEGMLRENPFYVSNQRILPKSEKGKGLFNRKSKNQFTNQNADVKKAVGSQLQIVDPIESTIERTDKLVKVAKTNEVMQVLARNIEKDPGAFEGFARIVPEKELSDKRITKLFENLDELTDDFSEQFVRTSQKADGNIFYFMKDGKKQYMELTDPDFINAVANLEPHTRDIITRNVGKLTNKFKLLVTGNPVFALTKNVWKDIPQAYANSYTTNNPLTFSKDIVTSFLDIAKNKQNYKDFKAIGGGHSSSVSADRNLLKQSTDKVVGRKGLRSKVRGGFDWMENFNNAIESAPRLAEYKRVMREYDKLQADPTAKTKVLQKGVSKYGAKQEALYQANDITLNFKKHGNAAKTADAYIPYLNASIQGLDKMARTFAGNPVKYSAVTAAKAITAISAPTMLLYAINHDDPAYQELSDHVKDNYMLIPKGDGKFTKIPVPRELGPIFKAGVERTLRKMWDDDPEAFKHYTESFKTAFLPPGRTIFAPIGDIRANKDYNEAPIIPGSLEKRSPKYQYDSKTTAPAKFIGNKLNYSPKKIDYLGKQYGGVIANLGQPATTESTTLGDWWQQQFSADPVFSNDYQRDFYEKKEKIDQQYADYKAGETKKQPDRRLKKWLDGQNKKMSDKRKEMKKVLDDKSLSRKERSEQARKIQEAINQLANLKNFQK